MVVGGVSLCALFYFWEQRLTRYSRLLSSWKHHYHRPLALFNVVFFCISFRTVPFSYMYLKYNVLRAGHTIAMFFGVQFYVTEKTWFCRWCSFFMYHRHGIEATWECFHLWPTYILWAQMLSPRKTTYSIVMLTVGNRGHSLSWKQRLELSNSLLSVKV